MRRFTAALVFGLVVALVVPGAVKAADVVKLKNAGTVNGQRVDIKVDGAKVQVDGANVVTTDIACSNDVIHVIDSVVLPK